MTPTPASRQHWGPGGHGNGQTLPLETVVSEGRRACLTRAPGRDFLGTMCNIPAEPLLLLTPCGGREATAAGCPPGPTRGQAEGAPQQLEQPPALHVPQRPQGECHLLLLTLSTPGVRREPAGYRLRDTRRDSESSLFKGSRT